VPRRQFQDCGQGILCKFHGAGFQGNRYHTLCDGCARLMQLFSVPKDQCSSQAQKVNGLSSLQHSRRQQTVQ
jgi:hypothetical protein